MSDIHRSWPIVLCVAGLALMMLSGCQSTQPAEPAALTGKSELNEKSTKESRLTSHRVGKSQQVQHRRD